MTESKLRWCQRDVTYNSDFGIYGSIQGNTPMDGAIYLQCHSHGEIVSISEYEFMEIRTSGRIYHFKLMEPPEEGE